MRRFARRLIRPKVPLPPPEMRQLVGPTDPTFFENPQRKPVFEDHVPGADHSSVFDFGCGCGRIARQLIQQRVPPGRYVGTDVNREMVSWCQENLTPVDDNFTFQLHDVYSQGHGAQNTHRRSAPYEVEDSSFSLTVAWSVFTHVFQEQAVDYLSEMRRILRSGGHFLSTWFLFDKREFPMMQPFQNTLFINRQNPTNAVIYDRTWLKQAIEESGLTLVSAVAPPKIRGYHWVLVMQREEDAEGGVDFPPDDAPYGSMPPPLMPEKHDPNSPDAKRTES